MIPAWTSGKGFAGIIGLLIWNMVKHKTFDAIIPIISIPVAIINLFVYFYLIKNPVTNRSEVITGDDETELIGFRNKINYIPKLFKYMIPLGLAVIFQLFGIQIIVRIRKKKIIFK